jgi:hypothetical protein
MSKNDNSYMCSVCGIEHDSIPKAIACFESHQTNEHVLEESVTLEVTHKDAKAYPVKAPELLGRAATLMHERGKTYDKPEGERSMGRAVEAFNAITGHDLSESEGWLLMQVLKDVRLFTRSEYHADSAEDCIAYAALKAEAKGQGL